MVGRTNALGTRLCAVIAVSYPEGSVCTCTNGSRTLKAKDTGGKALFNVPIGEWTVSCTNGSNSKSTTVSITAEGQSVSVTISYELVLFDGGSYASETGGWTATPDTGGVSFSPNLSMTVNSRTTAIYTKNKLDLSGYTTLKFKVPSARIYTRYGVMATPNSNNTFTQYVMNSDGGSGIFSVDISSADSGYVAFSLSCEYGTVYSTSVSKVWLE